jgi:hypothetical protein
MISKLLDQYNFTHYTVFEEVQKIERQFGSFEGIGVRFFLFVYLSNICSETSKSFQVLSRWPLKDAKAIPLTPLPGRSDSNVRKVLSVSIDNPILTRGCPLSYILQRLIQLFAV